MRKDNTWGGAIEIKSACNIWNLKIVVKNTRDNVNNNVENKSKIRFIPTYGKNSSTRKIYIMWNGVHYEPIIHKKRHN